MINNDKNKIIKEIDLIIKDIKLNNSLKAIETILITYKNRQKKRKNKLIIKSSNKRKWKYY